MSARCLCCTSSFFYTNISPVNLVVIEKLQKKIFIKNRGRRNRRLGSIQILQKHRDIEVQATSKPQVKYGVRSLKCTLWLKCPDTIQYIPHKEIKRSIQRLPIFFSLEVLCISRKGERVLCKHLSPKHGCIAAGNEKNKDDIRCTSLIVFASTTELEK